MRVARVTDAAHIAARSAALDVLAAWSIAPEATRTSRFDMVKAAAHAAVDAAWPAFVAGVEGIASPLCDCARNEEPPTDPATRALMDHFCDCAAVAAAAALLGSDRATQHAAECSCCGNRPEEPS